MNNKMKFALSLCIALAACSSADTGPDRGDGGPNDTSVADVATADAAPDVVAVADARPVDAGVDAGPEASVDAVAVVDAGPDTSSGEAAVDVAPDSMCGGAPLAECVVEGVPMCVNIRVGRPGPGGTTIHCGMCGNTCASGQVCSELRCQTL